MGVLRFNAFADMLQRTASLPPSGPLSFAFKFRLSASRGTYSCLFCMQKTDVSAYSMLATEFDGTTLYWYQGGAVLVGSGMALTVGTNYFIGCTDDGAGNCVKYFRNMDTLAAMNVESQGGCNAARTMEEWNFGSNNANFGSEYFDGCLSGFGAWTRVLSSNEMTAFSNQLNPLAGGVANSPGTTNLYGFWPMSSLTDKLVDFSGNSRNLAQTGAGPWTIETGPVNNTWAVGGTASAAVGLTVTVNTAGASIGPAASTGWTGTATVQPQGTNVVRITGLSLAAGATGTIGAQGSGADVLLPANFPSALATGLTLADLIEVRWVSQSGATGQMTVDKNASPFLATFAASASTGALEIYVQYFHSRDR